MKVAGQGAAEHLFGGGGVSRKVKCAGGYEPELCRGWQRVVFLFARTFSFLGRTRGLAGEPALVLADRQRGGQVALDHVRPGLQHLHAAAARSQARGFVAELQGFGNHLFVCVHVCICAGMQA